MRAKFLIALPFALVMLTAAAGDMSIATFLGKADGLKAKGILAMGSPEIEVLKGEMQGATRAYRTRIEGDKKAGKAPHSCPPAQAKMTSNDLMKHFRSYPASRQSNVSVRTGFFDLMKKRYPCK
ncbi:MAG: hypothetical protein RLZZ58_871 [Pseudomonadota bacterium]|jgi:inosine-uridine nucleoside N-ribohydrolase